MSPKRIASLALATCLAIPSVALANTYFDANLFCHSVDAGPEAWVGIDYDLVDNYVTSSGSTFGFGFAYTRGVDHHHTSATLLYDVAKGSVVEVAVYAGSLL